MDNSYQINLMVGAIEDYKSSLMSLGMLIEKVEGIMAVIQDKTFKDSLFESYLALEEVYARTRIGEFDFERHGKSVVNRALQDICNKADMFLSV